MDISDDEVAEMQMHIVRVFRSEKTSSAVWRSMKQAFPEYSEEDIKIAVWPVIKRMYDSI